MSPHLRLQDVTLCAVSSVAVKQTLRAINCSMNQISFGAVKLISHRKPDNLPAGCEFTEIDPLRSKDAYSRFIIKNLNDHIESPYVLLIQWDGYVIRSASWRNHFLDFDYIGAPWLQFEDQQNVGNGGFSLRSKRLLRACQDNQMTVNEAEDISVCRTHRTMLERDHGIRFADEKTARDFAYERTAPNGTELGFHGVFNMPALLGRDGFLSFLSDLPFGLLGKRERRELLDGAIKSGDLKLAQRILSEWLPRRITSS